jgi:hypothetical protein
VPWIFQPSRFLPLKIDLYSLPPAMQEMDNDTARIITKMLFMIDKILDFYFSEKYKT